MIDPHVVTASALRLRAGPSLSSELLASLPRGTVVELLDTDDQGRWAQVQNGRRTGWMATKYLIQRDHPAAPAKPSEEFPWMPVALAELGVSETPGAGSSGRVIEYLRSTELERTLASDDATPWCSGFANWCVEKAGFAGTNSAAARSWLGWGRPVSLPRRGCVVVFSRGATGGHVGFYLGKDGKLLQILGGNQGDIVCVSGYDETRLLGFRVPH